MRMPRIENTAIVSWALRPSILFPFYNTVAI